MFFLSAAEGVNDACLATLSLIFFFKEILKVVLLLIPVGLALMITIDFFRGVISLDDKDNFTKYIVKRIIYAIVIFLISSSVFSLFNIVFAGLDIFDNSSLNCWKYAGEVDISEVKNIRLASQAELEKEVDKARNEAASHLNTNVDTNKIRKTVVSNSKKNGKDDSDSGSSSGSNSAVVGQKYNLSSKDLKSLAYVSLKEQGSPQGAAAEATLMANRFELHGKKYKSIVKYVRNSGWFAHSKDRIDHPGKVPSSVMSSVKDVLVNGNRTLPLYIDEHDYFGDINRIVTGNKTHRGSAKKKRSNYKSNVTKIYNNMSNGSYYTFYKFPTSTSDPFGYTPAAKKKIDKMNN